MGKVKEEYHYDVHIDDETVVRDYILFDVSDDEEGYGVVIGGDDDDYTIAFGQGRMAERMAYLLYCTIVDEIEGYIRIDGAITPYTPFYFTRLGSPYDHETQQIARCPNTIQLLLEIIDYIANSKHEE